MNDIERFACWEYFSCSKVFCPNYGKQRTRCWLVPQTNPKTMGKEHFFQKLPRCLDCSYFRENGKRYPTGWNHFLADQLQNYNKQVLEQLYQKEESFVEILNRIPDGLFTTDHEWRITYFNPAAEKITGFSAQDAIGMYCKDVFKSHTCETDCALKKAIEKGIDINNWETVLTNLDNEEIPVICSTSAFQNSKGQVTGGVEIFKDVTELQRLQQKIIRREKKYSRIFEGSNDMLYTTNEQDEILEVNQAGVEMLGYRSKEELINIGSANNLYYRLKDRQKFLELINRDGYVKDFEVDFVRKNGSPIRVLISSRRYVNPESGLVEYEGIIKDITYRKQTEQVLKQRNWELSILNSIAVALNLTMDLEYILMVTLRNVLKVLRLDKGALFLIDRENNEFKLQVSQGTQYEYCSEPKIFFKDRLLEKHLLFEDVELNPEPTFPSFKVGLSAKEDGALNWLTCFLITFKGEAVGFFALDLPAGRELNHHELHLLGSLGNYLGGAIANVKLMETIRSHRQELSRLTKELFRSQEEERRRIARELHDETGQSLTAMKLGLERLERDILLKGKDLQEEITEFSAERQLSESLTESLKQLKDSVEFKKTQLKKEMEEIRKMVARTSSEIRRLSYNLHPTLLQDLGLEPALNLYFKDIRHRSLLDIDFQMVGFDQRLEPDIETVFYRLTQEALNNTLKHSGAERFRLSIIKSYPRAIFMAVDDGVGFDVNKIEDEKRGLGLLGMRERVYHLGGKFNLRSEPGNGTKIRIEIPVSEGQADDKKH